MVYAKRSGQKHLLHLLIQPHMTSYSIKAQSSIFSLSNIFKGTVSKGLSGSKDSVIPKKVFKPVNFGTKIGHHCIKREIQIQFPKMNTDRLLKKPYGNGVSLGKQNVHLKCYQTLE